MSVHIKEADETKKKKNTYAMGVINPQISQM